MAAKTMNVPAEATSISSQAELLLQDLLRTEILRTKDWDCLPEKVQEELKTLADVSTLLTLLTEHKLLTEYQAGRISLGRMRELLLGNYRVLDCLGSGGMGVVLKAEHLWLGREVALKVVRTPPEKKGDGSLLPERPEGCFAQKAPDPFFPPDSNLLKRFAKEMRALARVQHPNIVAAYDAGELPDPNLEGNRLYYFVMEFVPGQDLEEKVKKQGPLSVETACALCRQVASALVEADKHSLVHRDIKPANIRVTPEGQAKLVDFGLAREFGRRLTRPGIVMGTLDYLAPEQARDSHEVDIRADIFSLGATLFWSLTGRVPFPTRGSISEDLARRQVQPPPSARSLRAEIPAALDEVLARMMAPRPSDRYAAPEAVLRALFPFLKAEEKTFLGSALPPLAEQEGEPGRHLQTFKVLIVDDDPANRSLCRILLEGEGIHCAEAGNGRIALDMLGQIPFDLVLLDIDMPEMNGTEVLKRLRSRPPFPHLKVTMFSGQASGDDMAEMMRAGADDFLTKPFSALQLTARVRSALNLKRAQDRTALLHQHLLAVNHQLEQGLQARDCDLLNARSTLVLALAELVGTRDQETGAHLRRMQRYVRTLAEDAARFPAFAKLIDPNFVQLLECCAPLHDIGKVGIPDHILLKPGKLDSEERLIVESHTTLGANILEKAALEYGFSATFMQLAADIVRHHHERYDGTGYPDRLAGDNIPLAARILAVADVYDALRSRRIYKPALPHDQVVDLMLKNSPGHFDPVLLQAFKGCSPQFERLFQELAD